MTEPDPGLSLNDEARAMVARLAEVMPEPFHKLGVQKSRAISAALRTPPLHDDATLVRIAVVEGRTAPIDVRVYLPDTDARARPVIVYIHGGGWTLGSLDGVDACCRRLSQLSAAAVVSVDYRLAPENPYPAALHDCYDVLRWIRSAPAGYPFDAGSVALAGDSAGGNLAIALSLQLRDENAPAPAALAVAYPAVDHADEAAYPSCRRYAEAPVLTAADIDWFFTNYLGDREKYPDRWADPLAVPARAEHLRGLASTLIITADCDPLRDCGIAFAARLNRDGVEVRHRNVRGTVHGFCTEAGQIADADSALADIASFLGSALGT